MSHTPVHAPNAALLIDFDNVTLGIQKDLTKELRTLLNSDIIKGKVAVQRAYADWRRYPQYIVPLSESSIDLIFAPAFGSSKKNATDIRLAIDAVELVFTRPEIGTFILLSGDSDFSTMVIKLKEYGKYVIGVGIRESASDLLIQNCDEYFSYNDLAGLTKEVDTPSIQRDPWELAGEAVAQMTRNGDVMRSDRLKQVMQQIDANFDERNAGFNRFSKFVVEAGHKGVVAVRKLDNGQYEVGLPPGAVAVGRGQAPSGEAAPPLPDTARRGRGRRGRGRDRERPGDKAGEEARPPRLPREVRPDAGLTLARAFQLMTQALGELRPPVSQEALRLRMVAMHGRQDGLLDAGRFTRLLRQANDAEIADVRKVGDDDYEISPHARAAALPAIASPVPSAPRASPAAPVSEPVKEPAVESTAAGRDDGQRLGLRFRRGSRGPTRPGEVPLIGLVQVDSPPVTAEPGPPPPAPKESPVAKPRRASRKKAPASAAAKKPPPGGAPPDGVLASPAKRPRPRGRKRAE